MADETRDKLVQAISDLTDLVMNADKRPNNQSTRIEGLLVLTVAHLDLARYDRENPYGEPVFSAEGTVEEIQAKVEDEREKAGAQLRAADALLDAVKTIGESDA